MSENTSCCCSGSNCCSPKLERRQLVIDFLYLDLSVCSRCQGTGESLEEAIKEVAAVLKAAGYNLIVNKINITSKELALKYHFISSPTIRINGQDIAMEIKETVCEDCGDLCGDDSVDCRVWTYEGTDYNVPPKAFIINAILKAVYSEPTESDENTEYVLPENLKKFFEAKDCKE
jgi:hypothetical protein